MADEGRALHGGWRQKLVEHAAGRAEACQAFVARVQQALVDAVELSMNWKQDAGQDVPVASSRLPRRQMQRPPVMVEWDYRPPGC
eukprot:1516456-Alexandrium_andersonii.AAC.1